MGIDCGVLCDGVIDYGVFAGQPRKYLVESCQGKK